MFERFLVNSNYPVKSFPNPLETWQKLHLDYTGITENKWFLTVYDNFSQRGTRSQNEFHGRVKPKENNNIWFTRVGCERHNDRIYLRPL